MQEVMLLPVVHKHLFSFAESATWEKLQSAIRPAKGDQTLLEGHSKEAMQATLDFLVNWQSKMAVLRNMIADSLIILLRSPEWLQVAQLLPLELQAQLPVNFAGNEAMKSSPSKPRRAQEIDTVVDAIKSDMILGVSKPLMKWRKSKREFLRNMAHQIARHFEKGVTKLVTRA